MAPEYTVCTLSDNICLRGCCLTLSADLTGDNIHKTSSQWLIVLYRSCMWVNPWPHAKHPHTYTYFHYSVFVFLISTDTVNEKNFTRPLFLLKSHSICDNSGGRTVHSFTHFSGSLNLYNLCYLMFSLPTNMCKRIYNLNYILSHKHFHKWYCYFDTILCQWYNDIM